MGQYVAYDLKKVFALKGLKENIEISEANLGIAADSFLLTHQYRNFENFRKFKRHIADGEDINVDSLVASNPQFYDVYMLAGDYMYNKNNFDKALQFYKLALTKVIATKKESDHIKDRRKLINNKTAQ